MTDPVRIETADQLNEFLAMFLDQIKLRDPGYARAEGWDSRFPKPALIAEEIEGENGPQTVEHTTSIQLVQEGMEPALYSIWLTQGPSGAYDQLTLFTPQELRGIHQTQFVEGIIDRINRNINPLTGETYVAEDQGSQWIRESDGMIVDWDIKKVLIDPQSGNVLSSPSDIRHLPQEVWVANDIDASVGRTIYPYQYVDTSGYRYAEPAVTPLNDPAVLALRDQGHEFSRVMDMTNAAVPVAVTSPEIVNDNARLKLNAPAQVAKPAEAAPVAQTAPETETAAPQSDVAQAEPEATDVEAPEAIETAPAAASIAEFAALDVRDKLGGVSFSSEGVDEDQAQLGYADVYDALSYLPAFFNTYFQIRDQLDTGEFSEAQQASLQASLNAAEQNIMTYLNTVPEGYQAIAVQYVGDMLEAGHSLPDQPYKNAADNIYYGDENVVSVRQSLDALYIPPEPVKTPEPQLDHDPLTEERGMPDPAAITEGEPLVFVPEPNKFDPNSVPEQDVAETALQGEFVKANMHLPQAVNMPEDPAQLQRLLGDTAMRISDAFEQGEVPAGQARQLMDQFARYDAGLPEQLQYGAALKKVFEGGSYEHVMHAVDRRSNMADIDLSFDAAKDQIMLDGNVVQQILNGHQYNFDAQADQMMDMINQSTASLQTDAMRQLATQQFNPMALTESADPLRVIPNENGIHEALISARDPEIAKSAMPQTLDRGAQIDNYGIALVGVEAQSLRAPDGQALVLWEIEDTINGGTDFVLMSPADMMQRWNETYMERLDVIGDNYRDARKLGEEPQTPFEPLNGLADVAQDVSASLDKIRTLQVDHDFFNAQPDLQAMRPELQAAYMRYTGNEGLAEQLEAGLARKPQPGFGAEPENLPKIKYEGPTDHPAGPHIDRFDISTPGGA